MTSKFIDSTTLHLGTYPYLPITLIKTLCSNVKDWTIIYWKCQSTSNVALNLKLLFNHCYIVENKWKPSTDASQ